MAVGGALMGPRVTFGDTECAKIKGFEAYKIKEGDTLLGIVQNEYQPKDKKTLYQLVALVAKQNRIKDPNRIRAGRVIYLPPKMRCCATLGNCADIQTTTGLLINDGVGFDSKF